MGSHKDLKVWQKAIELADKVFIATDSFPSDQRFSLARQLQASIVSVPSNIAEGSARSSKKEFLYFLHVARGSLAEADTQLIIARHRGYIKDMLYKEIELLANESGRMLTKLIQTLKNSKGE
jgi:four helix bundle protein